LIPLSFIMGTDSRAAIHTYIHTHVHTYVHTLIFTYKHSYIHTHTYTHVHTGCPRRNVPDFGRVFLYIKVYRYNPKHLCPKLNGYGDNGQRKVWSFGGSTHCTCQLKVLSKPVLECRITLPQLSSRYICTSFRVTSASGVYVMYCAWNTKGQL
jgi:hypothetical protein